MTMGLSPHLHTIPDFYDTPNPTQCNVMNSCQRQRTSPVLMLLGSLSFSSSSCEQSGGSSCVSLTLLSPAASPRPHRVDVPSKICQGISVLSALLLHSFPARDPHFKTEEMKVQRSFEKLRGSHKLKRNTSGSGSEPSPRPGCLCLCLPMLL